MGSWLFYFSITRKKLFVLAITVWITEPLFNDFMSPECEAAPTVYSANISEAGLLAV